MGWVANDERGRIGTGIETEAAVTVTIGAGPDAGVGIGTTEAGPR
jgi:hypothetical protein